MEPILAINSGSSSLKATLFRADDTRRDWHYSLPGDGAPGDFGAALDALLRELGSTVPAAIGHRFVHGGDIPEPARRLDADELERLRSLVHLAPLHLPANLLGVELCQAKFNAPQIACFDTAFHHDLPELARRLPIPASLQMRRFGFHGLSYASVASRLPAVLGESAQGRVVVAHLGAGASLCLMEKLRSVDTTMGYTPAGGIPMATRAGDLDPGVMVELARRYDNEALANLVQHGMGLLALSGGESGDMRHLLSSGSPQSRFAVEYFCRQVRGAIGQLAARAGGIDALVFTGGIGENSPEIRARICAPLDFLGVRLDVAGNNAGNVIISGDDSLPVLKLDTDEESVIRADTARLLTGLTAP